MKAVLALVVLYIATFLVALGGTAPGGQQGKADGTARAAAQDQKHGETPIEPAKESDIRGLIELTGANDLIQDAADRSGAQYTEKIALLLPDKDRVQKLSAAFLDHYKSHFKAGEMTNQLSHLYDRHFSAEEIKGLLQFYGSPLGQKFAAEMPKLTQEIQGAGQQVSQQAARDAWQDVRSRNPDLAMAQHNERMGRRRK